jgi:hypothetical protein
MATVTGPLHSDAASGHLNRAVTYRRGRNKTTVTRYNYPGSARRSTPTDAQRIIREQTGDLMRLWSTTTPEERAAWSAIAEQNALNPSAPFMRANYVRLSSQICPTTGPTPTPIEANAIRFYHSATSQPNLWHWDYPDDRGNFPRRCGRSVWYPQDGYAIHIDSALPIDGQFTFDGFTAFEEVVIADTPLTLTPTFSNLPNLASLQIPGAGLTTAPTIPTLPSLNLLNLSDNALTSVDSIFIDTSTNNPDLYDGTIYADGGTNAAPTGASLIYRIRLLNRGWTLIYN